MIVISFNRMAYLVVSLLCSCVSTFAEDTIDPQASSLFRGVLANNESIESYDVLITSEIFSDSPVKGVEHHQVRKRQRWRKSDGNHLIASHRTTDTWGVKQEETLDHRESLFGATFKKEDRGVMIHNGTRQRVTTVGRNFEMTKRWVAWLNHVPFGIETIHACHEPSWKPEWVEYKISGNGNFDVEDNLQGQIVVTSSYFRPGESQGSKRWCFTSDTLMPVSYKWADNGIKPGSEYSSQGGEQIEWVTVNGVCVPSLLTNQHPVAQKTEDGKRATHTKTTSYQFQWFSVNEELVDSEFDESIIRTPELVRELLKNPEVKLGADARPTR